jgi:peroxiredoxin
MNSHSFHKLLKISFFLLFIGPGFSATPAPNFKLKGHDKKIYELKDYRGEFVVLEWFNHECPFVRKHYDSKNMQALQEEFVKKGIKWFSINSSAKNKQGHLDIEAANKIKNQEQSRATAILLDPEGKVGRLYQAKTTPHMYVINPQGHIIYQGAIDNRPSTDKSDIKEAKNYVKMALNKSLKGEKLKIRQSKAYGCSVKY